MRLGILQFHALQVGDGIDRLEGVFDGGDRGDQFARDGRDHLGDVLELIAGIAGQRFNFHAVFSLLRAD